MIYIFCSEFNSEFNKPLIKLNKFFFNFIWQECTFHMWIMKHTVYNNA